MDQCKLLYRDIEKYFIFYTRKVPLVRNSQITGGSVFYYIPSSIQNNIISVEPFPILWVTLNHDFHWCRFF